MSRKPICRNYINKKTIFEPIIEDWKFERFLFDVLDLELPWHTVDEESTSSCLEFTWSVYETLLIGEGPASHILACSRNSAKTLTATILQLLSGVQFRRDGTHLAATRDQSKAAFGYYDKFLKTPILSEVLVPHLTVDNIGEKKYEGLPPNFITTRDNSRLIIVVATPKGANSARASFMTFDEVDLTEEKILVEAAMIADPYVANIVTGPDTPREEFQMPTVRVYLSSRKKASGPIQKRIDAANAPLPEGAIIDTRPRLHKWSFADMMHKCPPKIHKPELGSIDAYVNIDTLKVYWGEEDYRRSVPKSEDDRHKKYEAFHGCKACPAWVGCMGRSVKQLGKVKGPIQKDVRQAAEVITDVADSTSSTIAQILNWRPETSGIVFRNYADFRSKLKPIPMYKKITGSYFCRVPGKYTQEQITEFIENPADHLDKFSELTPTKEEIYDAMIRNDFEIRSGIDYGYSPDPATCSVVGYNYSRGILVVLHVTASNNYQGSPYTDSYSNSLWSKTMEKEVFSRFPVTQASPDMADAAAPTYFTETKIFGKKPAKIKPGIDHLRGLMWDAIAQDTKFFILDDSETENGVAILEFELRNYMHPLDPLQKPITDKFEDDNNHVIDGLRYALHPIILRSKQQAPRKQSVIRVHKDTIMDTEVVDDEAARRNTAARNAIDEHYRKIHGVDVSASKASSQVRRGDIDDSLLREQRPGQPHNSTSLNAIKKGKKLNLNKKKKMF